MDVIETSIFVIENILRCLINFVEVLLLVLTYRTYPSICRETQAPLIRVTQASAFQNAGTRCIL
jgi:hypothetical protein